MPWPLQPEYLDLYNREALCKTGTVGLYWQLVDPFQSSLSPDRSAGHMLQEGCGYNYLYTNSPQGESHVWVAGAKGTNLFGLCAAGFVRKSRWVLCDRARLLLINNRTFHCFAT